MIDRKDQVITICEIKFHNKEFALTREQASKLKTKMDIFQESTQTRKQLFLVLITTFGIVTNEHSLGLVDQTLVLDDLFR